VRDYTIIIPSCTENNLRVCLEALKSKQPGALPRVQVYDSDLTGGVEKVCEDYHVVRTFDIGLRPFVFSRAINECTMFAQDQDAIVMNDDAILQTLSGLGKLHVEASIHSEFGIISSSVLGLIGNPEQHNKNSLFIRTAQSHTVAFVCVHISRQLIDKIGPMDERLIHYGWDDNLYCLQARAAGYKLGIYDGCIVEHGSLPSTYRTGKTVNLDDNLRIFESIIREKNLESHWPVPFKFPYKPLKQESD